MKDNKCYNQQQNQQLCKPY